MAMHDQLAGRCWTEMDRDAFINASILDVYAPRSGRWLSLFPSGVHVRKRLDRSIFPTNEAVWDQVGFWREKEWASLTAC